MLDPRSSPSLPAPTDFPAGIRLAQPGDRSQLLAILTMAHADNGFGGMDMNAIEAALDSSQFVFAIIPGPRGIEAVLGLVAAKPWWGDASTWHWKEALCFVAPDCRRSRHFSKLMAFAHYWSNVAKAPVIIDVMPRERLDAKMKAFGRHGKLVGGTFLFGDPEPRYLSEAA